nr:hypothetical protein [Candidatus Woesearchaeota archaeon]
MKKLTLLFVVPVIFLIVFANGCQLSALEKEIPEKETKSLSEFQVLACETADEAGTCNTRLNELGIVLKEDCCEVLGKCC